MKLALLMTLSAGCSLDGLLNSDELPPDVTDPALTQTPDGARRAYHGVLDAFRQAFGNNRWGVVAVGGLLSDELTDPDATFRQFREGEFAGIDQRDLPEGGDLPGEVAQAYNTLHRTRAQAGQAIRLLGDYLPEAPALAGRLYALQGYTEVFLAELFCSGIPLSTLDYDGDYTYQPGSSTAQILTHAVALFDTALGLVGDSVRFEYLARLGQARAQLGLGDYAAAAAAVTAVPDAYRYTLDYYGSNTFDTTAASPPNFAWIPANSNSGVWAYSVPDQEGVNGLDWRSSDDPRTPTVFQEAGTPGTSGYTAAYYPSQYATDGSTPLVMMSGVEARLVEAEAQLASGSGAWLVTLNTLRTDGTFTVDSQAVTDTMVDSMVSPPDTTVDTTGWTYDTLWHAGSGGVDGLGPLADPGTTEGRVDLVFRERAFWLFLTGHRQGDLRRLVRQYGRLESDVYPVGDYGSQVFPYGIDVTLPIPSAEYVNPLFTGCLSRGA